jgi:hypothetical protein
MNNNDMLNMLNMLNSYQDALIIADIKCGFDPMALSYFSLGYLAALQAIRPPSKCPGDISDHIKQIFENYLISIVNVEDIDDIEKAFRKKKIKRTRGQKVVSITKFR